MTVFTDSGYFTGPRLTHAMLQAAEAKLGFRLPRAYVDLLFERNGGTPVRRCFRMNERTSWAEDHIEIRGLLGIGGRWGIVSTDHGTQDLGSAYLIREWDYPDIGVVICETPSAGHDTVMLDYRACGLEGEPGVVHIDEDRTIRPLAANFAEFMTGLVDCNQFRIAKP